MSLFTPQINNTIKELLKELEHLPNFCEKICEKVNKQYATNFTLNQVRQYLKDELHVKIPQNRGNPFTDQIDNSIKEFMKKFVCIVPLSKDEKSFIVQWVERGDTIPWKELIPLMETKFKKLRSENIVKNFWYLRKSTPESTKSKAENKYSRKRSPKLKAKIEKQQKKVCHGLTTFESSPPNGDSNAKPMDTLPKSEENIIHLPLLNARPMEISFKSKERTNSPRLNARQMETSFKSKERIHLPLLNASPMEISFQSKGRIHLPPLNASPMEISFQSKGRIRLPPLNARPMEISFENEENTPPSNRMEILCWATAEAYKRDYPTK
ncbi:hypothetical protein RhiirA4_508847 [Rhizophagus irregularis]|uniref:Uncharacterized protein n=1 Tax=Rhizophagus irregularis TaxID=588596 RepID=A0A2I1HDP7_9GLOM|nr:hypothetical protein RhiirA4_508847 [Rhizophagus irregularis]